VDATRQKWSLVREQLADLDRRRITELRPDLAEDLERLRALLPG